MKSEKLERKIRKATKAKDYNKAMYILTKEYKKLFKKMLKYQKIKGVKPVYLHDYIQVLKVEYRALYGNDFEDMLEMLYFGKHTLKQQINWLLDNFCIFKEYKL
ncbi:MAG: hypothetical protein J6A15_04825 [Clostridia bacterium]|nr:hypothetical protein [Clostridia bacterium]